MICITNDIPDMRSCVHKGSHLDSCDGNEYQWIEKHHRDETTGKLCKGCEPRPAHEGFTCRQCFTSITAALAAAPQLLRLLAEIDRAATPDSEGRSSSAIGYVPIPGTHLAADEIERYLGTQGGTPEQWVSTTVGAENAVRFARAVIAAQKSFPPVEAPHRLKRAWCPDCEQPTLIWTPPVLFGMEVVITCRDPDCGKTMTQGEFEQLPTIARKAGKEVPA